MSIDRSSGSLRTEPLELKSSINTVQFLASIPIIGQLVSIVVELPLKLIATFSSRFRETELGAYYSQLDLKALGVSVLVPVIGSVVSRIAFREFDKDRSDKLHKAISDEKLESFQNILRISQFSDENVRHMWKTLKTKSFKDEEIQSKMFCLVYKAASTELRKELLGSLSEWVNSSGEIKQGHLKTAEEFHPNPDSPTFEQSKKIKEGYLKRAEQANSNQILATRISLAVIEVEAEFSVH